MNNILIIPARGGSKGIPEKNIKLICGKPLIAWSIESALKAKLINRVIVTTDTEKIASISRKFGAEVIYRPAALATDTSTSESAIIHCLEQLHEKNIDFVVLRQCTSPLVFSDDIDNAICLTRKNGNDSLFSAYKEHFLGRWHYKSRNIIPVNYKPRRRPMRQYASAEFIENGAIYVFKPGVIKRGVRFGKKVGVYLMPKERSFQIDTIEEFKFIEKILPFYLPGYSDNKIDATDIKMVILDFDGTMTDNTVIVDQNGKESVRCNRSDGLGITIMKNLNLEVVCITSEKNKVVKQRCDKLGIDVISSLEKGKVLKELLRRKSLTPQQCIFLGNDLNDGKILEMVKYPVVVNNAHKKAKNLAKIVLSKNGGDGAVLELAEILQNSYQPKLKNV